MDINEFIGIYYRIFYNVKSKNIFIETDFSKPYNLLDFVIVGNTDVIKIWYKYNKELRVAFIPLSHIKNIYFETKKVK